MEFTRDPVSHGRTSIKQVRCLPVYVAGPLGCKGPFPPGPTGLLYQVQPNEFLSAQPLTPWYQEGYYDCSDPLYPRLSLEKGFKELARKIHKNNLYHPLVIYGFLSNASPVSRGPVYMAETRDVSPLMMIDGMAGGGLGYGGNCLNISRDFITKKMMDKISNLDFWKSEIIDDEAIYGRPRRRYYPFPNGPLG